MFFFLITPVSNARADRLKEALKTQAFSVDILKGLDDLTGYKFAYHLNGYSYDGIKSLGLLTFYWEISINVWEFDCVNQEDLNTVIAISPVFTSDFYTNKELFMLRWEFGIGISVAEKTKFAKKDIGTHFQFEDRLGIAIDFGRNFNQTISIRYFHYSNAGLDNKNSGVDFLGLAYAYKF